MTNTWKSLLEDELEKPYMKKLKAFVENERAKEDVYPPKDQVFNAFKLTPLDKVKVIIMGQDPYHGPNQAHGLSFSVQPGVKPPPSLRNIFQEIQSDLGLKTFKNGCLSYWAKQGVLLLNATLTVRASSPKSHYNLGWEQFTDNVIEKLAEQDRPLVFLLWGKSAQEKCQKIVEAKKENHLILSSPHPSPYSAHTGFLGCRHFSKANTFLEKHGLDPIDWQIIE